MRIGKKSDISALDKWIWDTKCTCINTLMFFSIHIDTISMELFSFYLKEFAVKISIK